MINDLFYPLRKFNYYYYYYLKKRKSEITDEMLQKFMDPKRKIIVEGI